MVVDNSSTVLHRMGAERELIWRRMRMRCASVTAALFSTISRLFVRDTKLYLSAKNELRCTVTYLAYRRL